jgi:hypothetical protein
MFGMIPEWAVGVAFIMLAISVGHALSGRTSRGVFRGRNASRRDLAQAMEEVQRRLAEVEEAQRRLASGEGEGEGEAVQTRLGELEERLDFMERMLAKRRDSERLDSPKA